MSDEERRECFTRGLLNMEVSLCFGNENGGSSVEFGATDNPRKVRCHVAILREGEGEFSAVVLNLPGVGSYGATEDEAIASMREAVSATVESYLDDGVDVPWSAPADYAVPEGAKSLWVSVSVGGPEPLRCLDCGALYRELGLDLVLPDQQWKVIFPEESGVLCASCICQRASRHGGTAVLAWVDNLNYQPTAESVEINPTIREKVVGILTERGFYPETGD